MTVTPLLGLERLGQSVWMDFIRRGMITSGDLRRFIDEDGVSGVTSNPSIFEKAVAGSRDYDDAVRALALEGRSPGEMYQALTVEDIRGAADALRPVYDRRSGGDGFVSLEVSPHLAHDTEGTIEEARRLWTAVGRPNVMIKVPATREGIPAIRRLIGEGINVNVTLLFGLGRYREAAEAYIAGLEDLSARGASPDRTASVASFFLSRIDVLVDPVLDRIASGGGPRAGSAEALRGRAAVACAVEAYRIYGEIFSGERFGRLAAAGARTQRLLWASTSTKDPAYSDVKYVESLIGRDTINTLTLETLEAYRDHGSPAPRLAKGRDEARSVLDGLSGLGIDLEAVSRQLEEEGVEKFITAFDRLLAALTDKGTAALTEPVDRQAVHPGGYAGAVRKRIDALERAHFVRRLWRKDPRLWAGRGRPPRGIRSSLGWLHAAEKMEEILPDLLRFASEVRTAGIRRVVHMGMGGSSLAPLVLRTALPRGHEGLPLEVLDTTDPAAVLRIEREGPLEEALFIVASKSGTTAEPLAFGDYFYEKLRGIAGPRAGGHFVAVTDPGTPLEALARERGYRRTFLNFSDIGGRYSALSYFGLLPAVLLGADVPEILVRALRMVHACAPSVSAAENPGVALGAVLGELARRGRDKLTFLLPEALGALGLWLEQLLAESTGKGGTGILPVAGEPPGGPSVYGRDRVFVLFSTPSGSPPDGRADALRAEGHPVVTIRMDDALDVGQEFIRWEVATATAGAILGINPFDQPNVRESKENTERILARGTPPPEALPSRVEGPLTIYARRPRATAAETLRGFLKASRRGDYIALQAYLTEDSSTDGALGEIRLLLRDRLHLAATLGYGPRYLHSTGQYHKGGPNTGLFLLITSDDAEDAPIPGRPYTFGGLRRAQAQGDLASLRRHRRRVVHIHLGPDVARGLAALREAVDRATGGR